jgi:hypothetical protein
MLLRAHDIRRPQMKRRVQPQGQQARHDQQSLASPPRHERADTRQREGHEPEDLQRGDVAATSPECLIEICIRRRGEEDSLDRERAALEVEHPDREEIERIVDVDRVAGGEIERLARADVGRGEREGEASGQRRPGLTAGRSRRWCTGARRRNRAPRGTSARAAPRSRG